MSEREGFSLGTAHGADVQKTGDDWKLVLVRELRHPPGLVWEALTDPAQLREWAPFDADRSLATTGKVQLTTVNAPSPHVTECTVKRADAPKLLEHTWGDFDLRWELEPLANGTRLTLFQNIDRRYISWGAAGWHVCFEVLARLLDRRPVGRIAGPEAMKLDGWQSLHAAYTKQLNT
ncbi:MAG TPA: SRPBCC domain-containing protein [Polyangiaceae bacterium]|nr:SRPBCC domain-containing protein [Polyangiaceae bacterium]